LQPLIRIKLKVHICLACRDAKALQEKAAKKQAALAAASGGGEVKK
jgi:hypothetical protein